ncbi:MAG: anthranilate synthase component I family protein [bacterium]
MDMIAPTFEQFRKFAAQGNVIPVYCVMENDIPAHEAYRRIRTGRYSFLLESGRFHPKIGRFSFCGTSTELVFRSRGERIEIKCNGETMVEEGSPLEKLRSLFADVKFVPTDDPFAACAISAFAGGAVGFISYEARRLFEKLPSRCPDDIGTPDFYFIFCDTFIVFDLANKRNYIVSVADLRRNPNLFSAYEQAIERIEEIYKKVQSRKGSGLESGIWYPQTSLGVTHQNSGVESNYTDKEYEEIVRRAKEYIASGDIYQANLSQRLCMRTDVETYDLYRVLLEINPSPFGGCLEFDGFNVASSSPERLVWTADGIVETRPIAGTRPRGRNLREDREMSAELILNEKERAEHIMLVDLERNDIGRVCRHGSVHVDELMVLEKYSHVIHIVSNVRGTLKNGCDRFDVIRACFPGGTITGVPKVRCMEIIDELENVRRGLYTGSIGYISYNGTMDMNIVIRTFVIRNGRAYVQVGAGIVADSDPEHEYYETLHKAEALLKTLERVGKEHNSEFVVRGS